MQRGKRSRLRFRLYLTIIPLVCAVVLLSGVLTSLESRTALTRLANRHMAYKAEQLRDYVYSEWSALQELGLETQSSYREAMKDSFRTYAASLLRSKTESIIAFDSEGKVVMQVDPEGSPGDSDGTEQPARQVGAQLQPGWFTETVLGEARVGVAFEVKPFGWTVAVMEKRSAFFSDIQNIRRIHLFIFIAAVAVAAGLIYIFVGHVVGPVERLTDTIGAISATMDLSRRAQVEFGDEIGVLAQKFNTMIATLQSNYEQLQKTSRAEEEARKTALQREAETLLLLGRISDFRDEETGEHLRRIGTLSQLFARLLGYDETQQELIRYSSPLHDIGKIGIPDAILLKPGKLDAEEYRSIQQHTVLGYELLKDTDSIYLMEGARIAFTHHEKWDGSGYPRGLSGEDIPIFGRIVGLVDVFDALTSDRPYKRAWSYEETLDFIRDQRGAHFDPQLVDLFESHFNEFQALFEYPSGTKKSEENSAGT